MAATWCSTRRRRSAAGRCRRGRQEYGFRAGFALLVALFLFATWNDLSHFGLFRWVRGSAGLISPMRVSRQPGGNGPGLPLGCASASRNRLPGSRLARPFRLRALLLAAACLVAVLAAGVARPSSAAARRRAGARARRAPPATVQAIDVDGNQRIEADTVRSYMLLQPGDAFDAGPARPHA